MSKEAIFSLFNATSQALTPLRILAILAICLCGSMVIYFTYRFTTEGTAYNRSFNTGNVIASLVTCVIMLMISSNIVISLGMVGALSIVRFRTAIKEARDTLFMFWSIVLGLCVGSQNFTLAGLSTFFIAAVCFAFRLMPKSRSKYTVVVRASQPFDSDKAEEIMLRYTSAHTLAAVNQTEKGTELVYSVKADNNKCINMVNAVKQLDGVKQVNLINNND